MHNRRSFIKQSALAAGAVAWGTSGFAGVATGAKSGRLTILHTNDTHSRLDPFPMDGSTNAGQGGVAARAALINAIRATEQNVLLLDAGDIFQGTPYFNLYNGEPEIKAMTAMGYDACTIGNHDFDGGVNNLALQLQRHASFSTIVSNYDFTGTDMAAVSAPYRIIRRGGIKVGLLGIGIELDGLVPANLYGATRYLDPVTTASQTAARLQRAGCDFIICLSHLGYKYANNKISDRILAKETEGIDLIIGGHTHSFMEAPELIKNKKGDDVVIHQAGWAGLRLGRLDFDFSRTKKERFIKGHSLGVTKKTAE